MDLIRSRFLARSVTGLALVLTACGGAGAPPSASPAPSSAPSAEVAPPPADVSAVPEPSNLILTGRLKPAAILNAAKSLTGLPMPGSRQVTELITGEAVGDLVDLDQPIDFAVAIMGKGMHIKESVAVSAAMKDPVRAKAAFLEHFKLVPADNGSLIIQGLGRGHASDTPDDDEDDDDEGSARACKLAPAYGQGGQASTRLVCGFDSEALTSLGPYLTRTLTRTTPPSEGHIEYTMAPLKSLIGDQRAFLMMMASAAMSSGSGEGVRALVSATIGDLLDLANDLDKVAIDLQLGDASATLTTAVTFASTKSHLAQLAMSHPERTDVPPAAFWQLPSDAHVAVFHRGIDPGEFSAGRNLVLGALGGKLQTIGVSDADRKALTDALRDLVTGSPAVYGSGIDLQMLRGTIARDRDTRFRGTPKEKMEAHLAVARALVGWHLIGVQEPPAKMAKAAKDLAAAWSRPSLARALKAKDKNALLPSLRLTGVPKGATLPKDTLHLELDVFPVRDEADVPPPPPPPPPLHGGPPLHAPRPAPPAAKVPPMPVTVHILLVPDGDRTWIAMGGDASALAAKAASVLTGADPNGQLGHRAGLDAVHSAKIGSGGFFEIEGLSAFAGEMGALIGDDLRGAEGDLDALSRMPHGGTTPIPFAITAQSSPGPLMTTVTVPKAAIEDLIVSVASNLRF
jgi:hypothetical protein